ncbi:hypothetical protein [Prauserella flavalba]|uniref:hypothetical protein n=1 Tax=Prauserella flavalba TaxID=1477506 RepID=UPI0036E9C2AA
MFPGDGRDALLDLADESFRLAGFAERLAGRARELSSVTSHFVVATATPSASGPSWSVSPTATTRSGGSSIVVLPYLCSIVTGNAPSGRSRDWITGVYTW